MRLPRHFAPRNDEGGEMLRLFMPRNDVLTEFSRRVGSDVQAKRSLFEQWPNVTSFNPPLDEHILTTGFGPVKGKATQLDSGWSLSCT